MKKALILSLVIGAGIFSVPTAEAKPTGVSAAEPQVNVQIRPRRNRWNRWNRGQRRVVVSTRIVRVGAYRYRETIRTTYLPNGTVRRVVVNRTRLGRWVNY